MTLQCGTIVERGGHRSVDSMIEVRPGHKAETEGWSVQVQPSWIANVLKVDGDQNNVEFGVRMWKADSGCDWAATGTDDFFRWAGRS